MKKALIIAIASIGFGGAVLGSKLSYTTAFAEEEPTSSLSSEEIIEENEEEPKQDFIEKWEEIKKRQILGTTVGGIISTGISLVVCLAYNKINKIDINKAHELVEFGRESLQYSKAVISDLSVKYSNAINEMEELEEKLEISNESFKTLKAEIEALKEENEKKTELLTQIIAHSEDCIKNGLAEKILGGK